MLPGTDRPYRRAAQLRERLAIAVIGTRRVNHSAGEYVSADRLHREHASRASGRMLKRGINGTHIHVSAKHLPKYLGEFEYRWNMRARAASLMLDRLAAFLDLVRRLVMRIHSFVDGHFGTHNGLRLWLSQLGAGLSQGVLPRDVRGASDAAAVKLRSGRVVLADSVGAFAKPGQCSPQLRRRVLDLSRSRPQLTSNARRAFRHHCLACD